MCQEVVEKQRILLWKQLKQDAQLLLDCRLRKSILKKQSKKSLTSMLDVYTIQEILNMKNKPKDILIDELPLALNVLLDCNVIEATMTSKSREMYDIQRWKNGEVKL